MTANNFKLTEPQAAVLRTAEATLAEIAKIEDVHAGAALAAGNEVAALLRHAPKPAKTKKAGTSRPARWAAACSAAASALDDVEAAKSALEDAVSELQSLKEEYEEWRDNLPENLQSSALYEKLEAVCAVELDVDSLGSAVDDLRGAVDEAEGCDLPRGFGKD